MSEEQQPAKLKLYMLLLGSKAPGRHVEQHDFYFGIGTSLRDLVPAIKTFWSEAAASIHIDGWREINVVDGYHIEVVTKPEIATLSANKLFFINLGGYLPNQFQEQHYTVLTVRDDKAHAIKETKRTVFYKTNSLADVKGANSHIDDKYGIDVDEIYKLEELLTPAQKAQYHIRISPADDALPEDEIHLGYFQLHKL